MLSNERLLELASRQDFAPDELTVMARELIDLRAWAAGIRAAARYMPPYMPPPPEGAPES
jgi:hypothetical protein